jgi:NADH-quinone oxidoreductase subunit I
VSGFASPVPLFENPKRKVKVVDPRGEIGFWERLYLPEFLKGLSVTVVIFFTNLFHWVFKGRGGVTIQYPEEKLTHNSRYRGLHILAQREDGSPKCVACYMCSTVCPAECIYIEAAEHPDPRIEKYPVRFDIDLSRCVFCGFCEEACPCEAIYLTDDYSDMAQDNFSDMILTLEKMLNRDQRLVEKKRAAIRGRR